MHDVQHRHSTKWLCIATNFNQWLLFWLAMTRQIGNQLGPISVLCTALFSFTLANFSSLFSQLHCWNLFERGEKKLRLNNLKWNLYKQMIPFEKRARFFLFILRAIASKRTTSTTVENCYWLDVEWTEKPNQQKSIALKSELVSPIHRMRLAFGKVEYFFVDFSSNHFRDIFQRPAKAWLSCEQYASLECKHIDGPIATPAMCMVYSTMYSVHTIGRFAHWTHSSSSQQARYACILNWHTDLLLAKPCFCKPLIFS